MFGWFTRKSKQQSSPESTADNQPTTIAAEQAVAQPSPQPTPHLADAVAAPAQDGTGPSLPNTQQGFNFKRITKAPDIGAAVIEVNRKRKRPAKVVRVQAGGRRILARLQETGRTYAYTRRPDGTFHLEQAPMGSAARLVSPAQ